MKIMLISTKEKSPTCLEMVRQLGSGNIHSYDITDDGFLDNDQKYFDCIYSPDPDLLLKMKLKIPYFYDIPSGRFKNDLNYRVFDKHYSQLGGAKAVFVNDKKMSRYAHWAGLQTYWINEGIDFDKTNYTPKNYLTPKLHIGYIFDSEDNYDIIKDVISAKKQGWVFHLYGVTDQVSSENIIIHEGNIDLAKNDIYRECHILLNPALPHKNTISPMPSQVSLEAMHHGCISMCGNMHDNADHLFFDKYHYFKLDFIDHNTMIETLRYADKRREKLSRMSIAGRDVVNKYYDSKESALSKLNIIKEFI